MLLLENRFGRSDSRNTVSGEIVLRQCEGSATCACRATRLCVVATLRLHPLPARARNAVRRAAVRAIETACSPHGSPLSEPWNHAAPFGCAAWRWEFTVPVVTGLSMSFGHLCFEPDNIPHLIIDCIELRPVDWAAPNLHWQMRRTVSALLRSHVLCALEPHTRYEARQFARATIATAVRTATHVYDLHVARIVADDAVAHALRVRSGVHMIGAANWIYDRRWFASTH